jgi:hypothetical protein
MLACCQQKSKNIFGREAFPSRGHNLPKNTYLHDHHTTRSEKRKEAALNL